MSAPHRPARRRGALVTTLVTTLVTVLVASFLGWGGKADAAPVALGLVAENFNVAPDGSVDLTVSFPNGTTPPAGDFTVTLTAFRPVATRTAVQDAINGRLPRLADSVNVASSAVQHPAANELRFLVPVETTIRSPSALQLIKPGLYPVTVEVTVAGNAVATLTTFVHRLPGATEDPETPLPIAVAVGADTPVTVDDHGRVVVGGGTTAELTHLAELLESSAVPVTVRVPPAVLTSVAADGADGAALVDRLKQATQRHAILSAPVLPLDPSLAAAASQQALYTQWLRDGEDSLAKNLSVAAQRTVTFVDQPLNTAGGALLRDLGARLLVITPSVYDSLPNSLGTFTDTTQLVQVQVADGVTIDATVTDRTAAQALTRVTTSPLLNAIDAVTDLLAARQQVEDLGGDPSRHSITLATPTLTLPAMSGWAAFTQLLANTPGLRPATLDEVSVRTDELLGPDGPAIVNLPAKVPGDLAPRVSMIAQLSADAISTASMLPNDDQRIVEWNRLIDALPTGAMSDASAQAVATALTKEFTDLRNAVGLPASFSFNLTGRTGTIPVNLHNNADIPLKVKLRLSSSKLVFPGGDKEVVLAPEAFTHVQVNVEARSNGSFPVTLEVFSPAGTTLLAPALESTASITALSGIAPLITAAALLLLLTWWGRHARRNRRARRAALAAASADRHPTAAPDDDPSGLSPDAEASTLPPS
jgi:hypothetical protein